MTDESKGIFAFSAFLCALCDTKKNIAGKTGRTGRNFCFSAICYMPSCYMPFATCHLPFATCNLLFAICHLPSANTPTSTPPQKINASLQPSLKDKCCNIQRGPALRFTFAAIAKHGKDPMESRRDALRQLRAYHQ